MMQADMFHIDPALRAFVTVGVTQGQEHIRPFHQYIASRLVIEGGFLPEEVTPHPPLLAQSRSGSIRLAWAPDSRTSSELTVFGGMKTKQIDVVVSKAGVGPVVAVSVKGAIRAYRNLVNRMEEAIGDSTNLHVMYPGLVYGFVSLLRANRQTSGYDRRDCCVNEDGTISPMVQRYWAALREMSGRRFVRNDYTRYEAIALAVVHNDPGEEGRILEAFPPADCTLRIESFFQRLYEVYDLRFPLRAEHVGLARRVQWASDSPIFEEVRSAAGKDLPEALGYRPRGAP